MTFKDLTQDQQKEYENIDFEQVRRYELADGRHFVIKYPIGVSVSPEDGAHNIIYEWLDAEVEAVQATISVPFDGSTDVFKYVVDVSWQEYMEILEKQGAEFKPVKELRRIYELADSRKITLSDVAGVIEEEDRHIVIYDFNGKPAGASIPYSPKEDALRSLVKALPSP